MSSIDRMYRLVARPVVTEKGSNDTADRNAYHFRVPVDANKVEIRQAIERVFEVKVKKVNTNQVRGKERRRQAQTDPRAELPPHASSPALFPDSAIRECCPKGSTGSRRNS